MNPREFVDLMTAMATLAQVNGLYYRELIGQGFTPEQALELVKTMVSATLSGKGEDEL